MGAFGQLSRGAWSITKIWHTAHRALSILLLLLILQTLAVDCAPFRLELNGERLYANGEKTKLRGLWLPKTKVSKQKTEKGNGDFGGAEIGYPLTLHKNPKPENSRKPAIHENSASDQIARFKEQLASSVNPKTFAIGGLSQRRRLKFVGGCSETEFSAAAVVECTNAFRANPDAFASDYPCSYEQWRNEAVTKSLVTLSVDSTLTRMAQLHTDDQARMNSMTHTGSDGSSLQIRADRVAYDWSSLGENVAVGFTTAKQVVLAWACSPGHRKNLLSCDFDSIGLGVAESAQGRIYYTQNFGCDGGRSCGCSSTPTSIPEPTIALPIELPEPVEPEPETTTFEQLEIPSTVPAVPTVPIDIPPLPFGVAPGTPDPIQDLIPDPFRSEPVASPAPVDIPTTVPSFLPSNPIPIPVPQPASPQPVGLPFGFPDRDPLDDRFRPTVPSTNPEPQSTDYRWDCGWVSGVWHCDRVPVAPPDPTETTQDIFDAFESDQFSFSG